MGSVAQAVLEFDEAVRVPWRPPLAAAGGRTSHPAALRVAPSSTVRRPHAPRVGRLTGTDPAPARQPAGRRGVRRGSAALRHGCRHCSTSSVSPAAPVRLTRRARRLLVVAGAAVGLLAGLWTGSVVTGGDEGLDLASQSTVVVQKGDTVWSIAEAVAGDVDVRSVVDAIQELNGLGRAPLAPGQVLQLP